MKTRMDVNVNRVLARRQALRTRGRGTVLTVLPSGRGVTKYGVSRSAWEGAATEGNSPVDENDRTSRALASTGSVKPWPRAQVLESWLIPRETLQLPTTTWPWLRNFGYRTCP
jgi:hypothetical protein